MDIIDLLMVVGADELQGIGERITVGPELRLVCEKTREAYHSALQCHTLTLVIATAGVSAKQPVAMNTAIRDALLVLGIPDSAIVPPDKARAITFNTDGEMIALCRYVEALGKQHPHATIRIHLVCRWWHMNRALHILTHRLEATAIRHRVELYDIRAQSREGRVQIILEKLRWCKFYIRVHALGA